MKPVKLFLFALVFFIVAPRMQSPWRHIQPYTGVCCYACCAERTLPARDTPIPTLAHQTGTAGLHPPLSKSGPYLAYQDQAGTQTILKFLDADGTGQASFSYPSNAAPAQFLKILYPIPSHLMAVAGLLQRFCRHCCRRGRPEQPI